jgi:hypothetical protein
VEEHKAVVRADFSLEFVDECGEVEERVVRALQMGDLRFEIRLARTGHP